MPPRKGMTICMRKEHATWDFACGAKEASSTWRAVVPPSFHVNKYINRIYESLPGKCTVINNK
jgi:hypothetical protein